MLNELFKSIIDQDQMPVVVCDAESKVVYMNPASIDAYHKDVTGTNIKDCHPAWANERIERVLSWFMESEKHNIVFTYHNEKENKDIYMVALRDAEGNLIGYYEKHESRNVETKTCYSFE